MIENYPRLSFNKGFVMHFSEELTELAPRLCGLNLPEFPDLHHMRHKTKCRTASQLYKTSLVLSSSLAQIFYYCWLHSQPHSWLWLIFNLEWIGSCFLSLTKAKIMKLLATRSGKCLKEAKFLFHNCPYIWLSTLHALPSSLPLLSWWKNAFNV